MWQANGLILLTRYESLALGYTWVAFGQKHVLHPPIKFLMAANGFLFYFWLRALLSLT